MANTTKTWWAVHGADCYDEHPLTRSPVYAFMLLLTAFVMGVGDANAQDNAPPIGTLTIKTVMHTALKENAKHIVHLRQQYQAGRPGCLRGWYIKGLGISRLALNYFFKKAVQPADAAKQTHKRVAKKETFAQHLLLEVDANKRGINSFC